MARTKRKKRRAGQTRRRKAGATHLAEDATVNDDDRKRPRKRDNDGTVETRRDATAEFEPTKDDEVNQHRPETAVPKPPRPHPKATGKPLSPEAVKAFDDFVLEIVTLGVPGLRKEFAEMKSFVAPNSTCEKFRANVDKNRYKDVICLDATRTVLTLNVPPETDYIHASWMKLEHVDKVFIAAQGPTEKTTSDFWRLCFQESVSTIVALCNIIEGGKVKCAQYWPLEEGTQQLYGCMFISNIKVTKDEGVVVYTLEVSPEGFCNPVTVKLVHMTDWPDRGVPKSGTSILRLLRRIDKDAPCLVHCSAGIGRTGTTIAVETVIQRLLKGIPVHMKLLLQEMRCMRACAVQTEGQYVFIVSAVFSYLKAKMPMKYQKESSAFRENVQKACMV